MGAIPKLIGLISCGFLLCLGLSNAAQADDAVPEKDHTRQPGDPRVGGQGGKPAGTHTQKGEAGKPHTRQPGGPRVGGQGGQ